MSRGIVTFCFRSSVLQIFNATTQDYGMYQCIAINGVGQKRSTTVQLNSVEGTENDSIFRDYKLREVECGSTN